ncbi:MAG: S41 family peptidase, partial [Anaerolineales bacterium]|nr:S41 family peptidase [Anaerolineales bacterium]
MTRHRRLIIISLFGLVALACSTVGGGVLATDTPTAPPPAATFTPLPASPIEPGQAGPDEPVAVTGLIPFTSPFFLANTAEPFVLLEDQAGFITRDKEFQFPREGQAVGPVEFVEGEDALSFLLPLPSVPQGTFFDLDNNGQDDTGVQVFAVAYWSNTWGDPFLERRDGTGWSTAYSSTIVDPDQENEIVGGTLMVWAPDENQSFPTGFGQDGLLFTDDDPAAPIPAGYNLVDLDSEPFRFYKEARPEMTLVEGAGAVTDLSDLSYAEAFDGLFDQASRQYPFTEEKNVDWQALYDEFAPRAAGADEPAEFYRAIRDFTFAIPDRHIGASFDPDVFFEDYGGSFGMVLTELSDGRVIVTDIIPGTPANSAGIAVGAEISGWNGQSVDQALEGVQSGFGPFSTAHDERLSKLVFLTRMPPGDSAAITFQNPSDSEPQTVTLQSDVEYESLFLSIPAFQLDELSLPVEGQVLDGSGLGYLKIHTFSDDYNMSARLWDRQIQALNENNIPGLIIDLRTNGGGSEGLALDFGGYFFEEEVPLFTNSYYSEITGQFEERDRLHRVIPGPLHYAGPIAVLVSPDCVSACEGFVHSLIQNNRAFVVGHYPTAGAFGEVGRGQYDLPDEISVQFPT